MNSSNLISEFYAMILVITIALFYYDTKPMKGFERRWRIYGCSLCLCMLSVILNIFCGEIELLPGEHTALTVLTMNTLSTFVTWLMITAFVWYIFERLFEFIYERSIVRAVYFVQFGILLCFTAILIYNLSSGCLFYVDEAGNYCRGEYNWISFMMPFSSLALVVSCYACVSFSITKITKKMVFVLVPVSLLLIILQYNYQEHRINGLICVTIHIIAFIAYNGGRADQDAMTGMESRRYLIRELGYRIEYKLSYQLILVKLRSLSTINRLYGERAGNIAILKIGEELQKITKDGKVYRYGDSEFMMMFPDAEPTLCYERLAQIRDTMRRRLKIGEYEAPIVFSVIEMRHEDEMWSFDDIDGYINDAMHYAGVNNLETVKFDKSLISRRKNREIIIDSMRDAFDEDRFRVWYQPVYYCKTDRYESAEALIRLYDRDGGMIPPSEFIPIAEETGIIDDITYFVVENVCRFLAGNAVPEMQKVCVNVPAKQILDWDMGMKVHGILKEYGIAADSVRFEITERDFERSEEVAEGMIKAIEKMGFHFMLDDFGTGYSNISRVLDMPLDGIKIDRSLVLQMKKSEKHYNIIKEHIVPLLHRMGHYVIAEGVENADMAELVRSCDINRIQGFYYAKPMSEEDLIRWYGERSAGEYGI